MEQKIEKLNKSVVKGVVINRISIGVSQNDDNNGGKALFDLIEIFYVLKLLAIFC